MSVLFGLTKSLTRGIVKGHIFVCVHTTIVSNASNGSGGSNNHSQ